MKQNDTKYHQIYLELKEAKNYFPKKDRSDLLKTIKDLYNEFLELVSNESGNGKYGIRYSLIGEDSSYPTTYQIFFRTKCIRDNIYDDWINGRHWDNIMNQELEFPTPTPNIFNIKKIFKESEQ